MSVKANFNYPEGTWLNVPQVRNAINDGMYLLSTRAYNYWISLIDAELHESKENYKHSLHIEFRMDNQGILLPIITLGGFLAKAIEAGMPPHDMKSRLISGAGKVKIGKDGSTYLTIPLHAGGNSKTEGALDPVARSYTRLMSGGTYSIRYGKSMMRKTNLAKMVKIAANSQSSKWGKATPHVTGEKVQFRRMSSTQHRDKWKHPGLRPRMFHLRVLDYIDNVLMPELIGPIFDAFKP